MEEGSGDQGHGRSVRTGQDPEHQGDLVNLALGPQ